MVLSSAGQSNHPLPPVPEPSIETHPTHDPPRTRPVSPEPTQATRAQTTISGLGVGVALPSLLFAHEQQPIMAQIIHDSPISTGSPRNGGGISYPQVPIPLQTSTSQPQLRPLSRNNTGNRSVQNSQQARMNSLRQNQRPTSVGTINASTMDSTEKPPIDDNDPYLGPPASPSGRVLDLGTSPRNRSGDEFEQRQNGHLSVNRGVSLIQSDRPIDRRIGSHDNMMVPNLPRTVEERLKPTITNATNEESKYARKALVTGYALNAAIGLQVFISALITALSAVTTGKRTQVMTSVLGGAGTVVASYLARARGSNEPELSIARVKDLQKFIRECDAFVQDHGTETGNQYDAEIQRLRTELEHLLGNGDGERRLSPPV